MKLFFHSLLLASLAAFSGSQPVKAIEINHLIYCTVTIKADGEQLTILVPKINLPKIIKQLNVVSVDCVDSVTPQPLF